ncbi:hypothetical protein H8356DRAFT_1352524 [Neocallimastix lanati (nom. inval.)]|nr:hypothetical protein H8356DRAFT_1352524 [Neocallimastix sp. JGI-2020a]
MLISTTILINAYKNYKSITDAFRLEITESDEIKTSSNYITHWLNIMLSCIEVS